MKNNKKNLKQIIYTIIITIMLISLVYVATRDNSYVGELPTEDIIKSEELQISILFYIKIVDNYSLF